MTTLRTRATKGAALSHAELDSNFTQPVVQKTAAYSCLVSDNRSTIECLHASTPFTVTLGDAATMINAETGDYEITIANIGAAIVTIARAGTDTINGVATSLTLSQYESVTLKVVSDGTGYQAVATNTDIRAAVEAATDSNVFTDADHTKLDTVNAPATGTPVATTSGTTASFAGIPSWATQVDLILALVSGTGDGALELTIGGSGGLEASGYNTQGGGATKGATGYILTSFGSGSNWNLGGTYENGEILNGRIVLTLADSATNMWGVHARIQGSDHIHFADGYKALTGTLTQIQLTLNGGTFDNGTIYIRYS